MNMFNHLKENFRHRCVKYVDIIFSQCNISGFASLLRIRIQYSDADLLFWWGTATLMRIGHFDADPILLCRSATLMRIHYSDSDLILWCGSAADPGCKMSLKMPEEGGTSSQVAAIRPVTEQARRRSESSSTFMMLPVVWDQHCSGGHSVAIHWSDSYIRNFGEIKKMRPMLFYLN